MKVRDEEVAKTFNTHVGFKYDEHDEDELQETSFAFKYDKSQDRLETVVVTFPEYIYVIQKLKQTVAWITMIGWEYIEDSLMVGEGRYCVCLASKTMNHKYDNGMIVLKFGDRVEAKVINTPGYVERDSLVFSESHNMLMAVCHDKSEERWILVSANLGEIFSNSAENSEVRLTHVLKILNVTLSKTIRI